MIDYAFSATAWAVAAVCVDAVSSYDLFDGAASVPNSLVVTCMVLVVLLAAPDLSPDKEEGPFVSFLHRVGVAAALGLACAAGRHGSDENTRIATICVLVVCLPAAFLITTTSDVYGRKQKVEQRDEVVEKVTACRYPAACLFFACARGLRRCFVQAENAANFLVRIENEVAVQGSGYTASFAPLDAAGYGCTCAACLVVIMSGASRSSALAVGIAAALQALSAVNASMSLTDVIRAFPSLFNVHWDSVTDTQARTVTAALLASGAAAPKLATVSLLFLYKCILDVPVGEYRPVATHVMRESAACRLWVFVPLVIVGTSAAPLIWAAHFETEHAWVEMVIVGFGTAALLHQAGLTALACLLAGFLGVAHMILKVAVLNVSTIHEHLTTYVFLGSCALQITRGGAIILDGLASGPRGSEPSALAYVADVALLASASMSIFVFTGWVGVVSLSPGKEFVAAMQETAFPVHAAAVSVIEHDCLAILVLFQVWTRSLAKHSPTPAVAALVVWVASPVIVFLVYSVIIATGDTRDPTAFDVFSNSVAMTIVGSCSLGMLPWVSTAVAVVLPADVQPAGGHVPTTDDKTALAAPFPSLARLKSGSLVVRNT